MLYASRIVQRTSAFVLLFVLFPQEVNSMCIPDCGVGFYRRCMDPEDPGFCTECTNVPNGGESSCSNLDEPHEMHTGDSTGDHCSAEEGKSTVNTFVEFRKHKISLYLLDLSRIFPLT